jgi:hypothetical protein
MREALGDQIKTYPSLQKQTILFSKLKTPTEATANRLMSFKR